LPTRERVWMRVCARESKEERKRKRERENGSREADDMATKVK